MSGPSREASEARRHRSPLRRAPVRSGAEAKTGHPGLFTMRPVLELGRMPEGGGYPYGFVEAAARLMDVRLADIVHLCSGSVAGGRLTIDIRRSVGADVVGDVRWLPLRPGSIDAVLVDPPYDPLYAEELWGLGRQYPMPSTILSEVAGALAPGGRVGFLHHLMPAMPVGLNRLSVHGVTTGPDYRIRALTIAERDHARLVEGAS